MEENKDLLKTLFETEINRSLKKKSLNINREDTHNHNDNNLNSKFKILYNYFIAENLNKNMGGEKALETKKMQNEQEKQNIIEGLKEKHRNEIKRLSEENEELIKKCNEEIRKNDELIKRHQDEIKKLEKKEEEKIFDEETNMEKDEKEGGKINKNAH